MPNVTALALPTADAEAAGLTVLHRSKCGSFVVVRADRSHPVAIAAFDGLFVRTRDDVPAAMRQLAADVRRRIGSTTLAPFRRLRASDAAVSAFGA